MSELSDLQVKADALEAQSTQDLHNATDILSRAQELHNSTNQVTVQQLQGQLMHYFRDTDVKDAMYVIYIAIIHVHTLLYI